jgi:moderate conductance mechanosensitive channel
MPHGQGAISNNISSISAADSPTDFLVALRDTFLDPAVWITASSVLLRVVMIIIFTALVIRLIDKASDRFTRNVRDLPNIHPKKQRALTISNLISSTARYFLWPVAAIMTLSAFAIDVGALIATAGIAGLAIGFGAQTLVKDVIGGLFLLIDDTIHVGDSIKIGGDIGTVEHIGVRMLRVRKFDGEVLMVPAGELRIFGNRSIGFARVIVNVGLSYEQDIETILPIMERVANEWAEGKSEILREEKPSVQAITDFADSSINARIVCMVGPGEQHAAERELRILLKREFDRLGIEIPFPRHTVYVRNENDLPPRTIRDEDRPSHEAEVSGSD